MPPPWMRAAADRHSPAMQRVYLRRRIVVGLAVLIPVLLIVFLLTRGGGGPSKVATHSSTTLGVTTTTAPPHLTMAQATWHLPIPLSRSVVLPVNSSLGIFGGLTTAATSRTVYEVDPATGNATQVGVMPTPVHDAAGAVVGSSYFVFGGGSTTETAAVQEFSFNTSTNLTGTVVANLSSKRADSASVKVNGQIYLVGGYDGRVWLPSVLDTPDGTTFSTVAQLAPAVRYPAVAALNGKLYVIGGELSPNQADATAVQEIDLQSGTVTALAPLPAGLSHAAAITLNNTIYVFGGRSGGHAIATVSMFNPTSGQLQAIGQMPAALSDMGVTVVGQTVYLVGGEGNNAKPVNTVVTARLVPAANG